MTDSFVTQCPHCQTSFRVSHAQLSVARGVVRCGSCLQVFNAAKQLLEHAGKEPVAPVVPAMVEAPPPAAPAPSAKTMDAASWTWTASTWTKNWPASSNGKSSRPRSSPASRRHLSARRDTGSRRVGATACSANGAERAQTEEEEPEPEPVPKTRAHRTFAVAGAGGLDDERRPPQLRLHDPLDHRRERLSATSDEHDDDLPSVEPLRKRRERSEPGVRTDVLQDLTDDPLQLDWQKRRSPGAGACSGFAGAARRRSGRPVHRLPLRRTGPPGPVPPVVPATVPANRLHGAIQGRHRKIKSSNLVVRSHPEFNGALVVDAIIYNRATFSQPFPLLELRFADLNGHLIASRRFKPGEYLSGDLEGMAKCPRRRRSTSPWTSSIRAQSGELQPELPLAGVNRFIAQV
jgi:predicted Zn finger-like uncharacterized protein